MFFPEGVVRVQVYGQPVDMRCSFDGLYALTRNRLGADPLSGELYVFINRRGTARCQLPWPVGVNYPDRWKRGMLGLAFCL